MDKNDIRSRGEKENFLLESRQNGKECWRQNIRNFHIYLHKDKKVSAWRKKKKKPIPELSKETEN